jgi:hypothetical protein
MQLTGNQPHVQPIPSGAAVSRTPAEASGTSYLGAGRIDADPMPQRGDLVKW